MLGLRGERGRGRWGRRVQGGLSQESLKSARLRRCKIDVGRRRRAERHQERRKGRETASRIGGQRRDLSETGEGRRGRRETELSKPILAIYKVICNYHFSPLPTPPSFLPSSDLEDSFGQSCGLFSPVSLLVTCLVPASSSHCPPIRKPHP